MSNIITPGWHIVVVDSGFVFCGDCIHNEDTLVITNVKQLRQWGTTRGLGELVNGPTPKTVIDPIPSVIVPRARVIFTIPVNEKKWSKA
jgi:hypothetical protein